MRLDHLLSREKRATEKAAQILRSSRMSDHSEYGRPKGRKTDHIAEAKAEALTESLVCIVLRVRKQRSLTEPEKDVRDGERNTKGQFRKEAISTTFQTPHSKLLTPHSELSTVNG